jgi:hypothetical protein
MSEFMKKPCQHCPFRRDVEPFLRTERAEEIAYSATNPYNSFPCHKTTEADEEGDEMLETENSKQCAGFLTMMKNECGRTFYDEDGFEPDFAGCYNEAFEMVEAYAEHNGD